MQFGYNCNNFLPRFEKCKFIIDHKNLREGLYCDKWLSIKDALIYSSLLNLDLMELIKTNKVKVRKDKKKQLIRLGFFTAWGYDECPLAHTGGQCLFFKQHSGNTISRLSDLEMLADNHPNSPKIPSEQEVQSCKDRLLYMVEKNSNRDQKSLFDDDISSR